VCGNVTVYCPAGHPTRLLVPPGEYAIGLNVTVNNATLPCPVGHYCIDGVKAPCAGGSSHVLMMIALRLVAQCWMPWRVCLQLAATVARFVCRARTARVCAARGTSVTWRQSRTCSMHVALRACSVSRGLRRRRMCRRVTTLTAARRLTDEHDRSRVLLAATAMEGAGCVSVLL
jgi:hypothetical protein